ncbi:MAG: radical SAM protein [Planctomycetota bacterium]
METLGITESTCNVCCRIVPAKVVTDGMDVFFQKFCLVHGQSRNLVQRDVENYLKTQRYVKPAWVPNEFAGESNVACPRGCGFCDRHEQHLCMPVVEITSRCDLSCPVCIVDAGQAWDMTVEEFGNLIDGLIRTENQVDVLNLSGGEPLIHPNLLEIVDKALSRPEIVRVSISTNGLALLREPGLLNQFYERNVVISLQFDGFDDNIYEVLRGRRLLREKLDILEMLADTNISTSLTVTAAGGVNDDQFTPILDYFFSQPHVVSMMIQPISFAGRGANLVGKAERLTIPDVIKLLDATGDSRVSASDFAPLPCSHPLCFCLAYYLILDGGGTVSLNRLVDASKMMDSLANRTIFGLESEEHNNLKDMIYEMWSGPAGAAPDSEAVMKTLRSILDEISASGFEPRKAFTVAERHIKSIFIHAFQDVETFDLSRVRRCCQAYPQPDGKLIPICVQNVLGRNRNGVEK